MARPRRALAIAVGAALIAFAVSAIPTPSIATEVQRVTPGRFSVAWHEQLVRPAPLEYAPRERSRPAVDAARGWIFVADRFGTVRSLDARGHRRWEADVNGPVEAGVVLDGDRLFVATARGRIFCFDSRTGRELWTYRAGTELSTTPTVADGRVLVPSLGDTLLVLDAESGEFLWFHRRPRPEGLTIRGAAEAAVSGRRVVTGFSDGMVIGLDLDDGRTLWTRRVTDGDFSDVDAAPIIHEDVVYVATYAGRLHALDVATGDELWSRGVRQGVVSMVRAGEHLVLASPDRVAAHRIADGVPVWESRLRGGTPTTPLVLASHVLVGTEEGALVALSSRTGRPTRAFAPGTGISAGAVPAEDGVWLWTNGGWLYRLTWSN